MFYASLRQNNNQKSLFGLIFGFFLIFGLFLPAFAHATTIWQGTGSNQSIESVIGDSLNGGNYSFGWSIDADGDTAVVGYPNYQENTGAAYILQRNSDGSWTRLAKLTSPVPQPNIGGSENTSDAPDVYGARFGWSVAISGDTVVVGAPLDQRELVNQSGRTFFMNYGAAYVFTKPVGGWADSNNAIKLNGSDQDAQDGFGWSVDIANNTVVVGSRWSQPNGLGAVYVYNRPADGWASTSSSVAILKGNVNDGNIGFTVAIDKTANTIVAGGANCKNQTVVFKNASTDWSSYNGPQLLTVANMNSDACLGSSVAVSDNGDTIIAGATTAKNAAGVYSGAAFVFYSPDAAWSATDSANSIAHLFPSDPSRLASLGESVAIKDNIILVGSPSSGNSVNTGAVGAVYAYVKPASGWADATENVKLVDNDNGTRYQYFGHDVAFLGDRAFSISTFNSDGSNGFSSFLLTQSHTSFIGAPVMVTSSGYVSSTVSVLDLKNNPVSLAVEYSTDGSNWQSATLVQARDSNGFLSTSTVDNTTVISGITGNITAHNVNFIWDSLADGVGQSATVYLRVTPQGGVGVESSSSTAFAVNNAVSSWVPTGLRARDITTSSLTLFWNPIVGAVSYNVSSTAGVILNTTATSAVFSNLTSSTVYSFQVGSLDNVGGASLYSAVFSTSTLANVNSSFTTTTNNTTTTTDNTTTTTAATATTTPTAPATIGNSGGGGVNAVIPTIITAKLAETGPVSSTIVHIISEVANAAQMAVSENADFNGASWEGYTNDKQYTLSEGDGEKTIYVKYRSGTGGVTETKVLKIALSGTDGVGGPGPDGSDGISENESDGNVINDGDNTRSTANPIRNNNRSSRSIVATAVPVQPDLIVSSTTTGNEGGVTNGGKLEIELPGADDNNGLIPAAKAGGVTNGFGTNLQSYFGRLINPENYWVIASAVFAALAAIAGGWFAFRHKQFNAIKPTQSTTTAKKDGKDDSTAK